MTQHTVASGECISSIAEQYGLFLAAIWDYDKNRVLRDERGDAEVLKEGDVLEIPEKKEHIESVSCDSRHKFRRKGVPALFTLQLTDGDEPRANAAYRIDIDGHLIEGKTDDDGVLEEYVPASAQEGRLILESTDPDSPDEEYEIHFGHLDPVSEESGVRQRLENLSYLRADATDDELSTAVIAFKEEHCGLEVKRDGTATDQDLADYPKITQGVRDKLVELHGS